MALFFKSPCLGHPTDLSIYMLMGITVVPTFQPLGTSMCSFYLGVSLDHMKVNAKEVGCRVLAEEDVYPSLEPATKLSFKAAFLATLRESSSIPIPERRVQSSDFACSSGCLTLPPCCRGLLTRSPPMDMMLNSFCMCLPTPPAI